MIGRSVAVVAALVGSAHADTLAASIAKGDIAALRAQISDPDARCALGVVYARKQDLARAMLFFTGCGDRTPDHPIDASIADDVERASRDATKKARDSDLAELAVVSRPEGMIAEIDALPGERFTTPATVWVKAGSYEVRAAVDTAALEAKRGIANHVAPTPHSRSIVLLDTGSQKKAEPHAGKVDLTDEPPDRTDGSPEDIKHKSLIRGKFAGAITGLDGREHEAGDKSEWIDDEPVKIAAPDYAPAQRVIVRAGVAMSRRIDQSAAGIDVGLEHHLVAPWEPVGATHPVELISRLDWSERGFHVLGAAVAAGKIIAAPSFARLGVGLGIHGQVRFADTLDTMPMSRFGIDAAASAELALRDSPLGFALRFEQGLNHIVPGSRELAVIFEVGLEFRDFKK